MTDEFSVPSARELLGALGRRWRVVVVASLIVGGAAFSFLGRLEAAYVSTATIKVSAPGTFALSPGDEPLPFVDVAAELYALRSDELEDSVVDGLGYEANVSVATVGNGGLFEVSAQAATADRAQRAASVFAGEAIERRRRELGEGIDRASGKLEARVADLVGRYNSAQGTAPAEAEVLRQRIDQATESMDRLLLQSTLSEQLIAVIQEAQPAERSGSMSVPGALVGSGALGLVAGCSVALVRELLGGAVRTKQDVERAMRATQVLAVIPKASEVSSDVDRMPYLPLRLAVEAQARRAVLLVSGLESTIDPAQTVTQLSRLFAEAGRSVVVLDLVGQAGPLLGISPGSHPAGYISNLDSRSEPLAVPGHPGVGYLSFPPGSDGLRAAAADPRLVEFVKDLGGTCDRVLVLGPDISGPLGLAVAAAVDTMILVAVAGVTGAEQLAQAEAALKMVGAECIGVALVGGRVDAN